MEKYKFRKYNKKFVCYFTREKIKLRKLLRAGIKIEHIGSSAVIGLGGKGVVDVLVAVDRCKLIGTKNKLIKNNYVYKAHAGDKERLFFEKDYKYSGKIRRVHIQLTYKNSRIERDTIKFRNILRNNWSILKKYSTLKKNAVKYARGDGKKYREYKAGFIKEVLNNEYQ